MTPNAGRWRESILRVLRLGHPALVLGGQLAAAGFVILLFLLGSGIGEGLIRPDVLVGLIASAGLYVGLLLLGEVRPREAEPALLVMRDQPAWEQRRMLADLERWKPTRVSIQACTMGKLNPVITALIRSEHTRVIRVLLTDPARLTGNAALAEVAADARVAMRHISEALRSRRRQEEAGEVQRLEIFIRHGKGIVSERGLLFEARERRWLVTSHYCVYDGHLHGSTNPVILARDDTLEGKLVVRHFAEAFDATWADATPVDDPGGLLSPAA